ncbi:hypothetical protein B0H19DRAFT_1258555 [Mycena capillaripes]|nr:hypothetical protein B0H19DRAFT_1258555 [Mycena capillaripes]
MSVALQVAELRDHIATFIQSSTDLRSWALISHSFPSSAQRRLFHDVILNRAYCGIDTITAVHLPPELVDEVAVGRRFISVLEASPHLVPLVRRLRVGLEEDFLPRLSEQPTNDAVCLAVGRMIALPSVRHLGQIGAIFHDWQSFSQLCSHSTPQLESLLLHRISVPSHASQQAPLPDRRASIQQLQLSARENPQWLLNPLSPFDFSRLANIDVGLGAWNQTSPALIRGARSTITRLRLDARNAINYGETGLTMLATLPALRHLSITGQIVYLYRVMITIGLLPSLNRVDYLELNTRANIWMSADTWPRLASAVANASLPSLQRLRIQACCGLNNPDSDILRNQLLAAFAEFDSRGQLELPPFT